MLTSIVPESSSISAVRAKVDIYNGATLVKTCTCEDFLQDFSLYKVTIYLLLTVSFKPLPALKTGAFLAGILIAFFVYGRKIQRKRLGNADSL